MEKLHIEMQVQVAEIQKKMIDKNDLKEIIITPTEVRVKETNHRNESVSEARRIRSRLPLFRQDLARRSLFVDIPCDLGNGTWGEKVERLLSESRNMAANTPNDCRIEVFYKL